MNKDFRIAVSLVYHPKVKKLMHICGDRAFFNLVQLWTYTAMNKPRGNLGDINAVDIEVISDWQGKPGLFTQTLLDLKLVEHIVDKDIYNENDPEAPKNYLIHDWKEHNEYAYFSPNRVAKASHAARCKHRKYDSYAKTLFKHAKTCSEREKEKSIYTNITLRGEEESQREEGEESSQESIYKDFLIHWNAMAEKAGIPTMIKLTDNRREKLRTRMKDPYWREHWKEGIDRIPNSDHLCCRNKDQRDARYKNWKANPDWYLKNDTVLVEIMEGKYEERTGPTESRQTLSELLEARKKEGG